MSIQKTLCWPLACVAALLYLETPCQAQEKDAKAQAKPAGRVSGFPDWVTSVQFSPDGKLVAAGSYDEVKLVDSETKAPVAKLEVSGQAQSLAFSPDGKTLAVGAFRGIELWDVAQRKRVDTLNGHAGYVMSLTFSSDGTELVSGAEDGTVRVWDVESRKAVRTIEGFDHPVMGVALSPDGRRLATASGDETRVTQPGPVRVWNMEDGAEVEVNLPPHEKYATSVTYSPDGRWLISTGADEKCNVYNTATGKALGFFAGHGRPVNAVVFADRSETVVSVAGGRAKGGDLVMVWNREDGEELARIEAHKGKITSCDLSSDGKTLVTGSYDQTIAFWDLDPVLPEIDETVLAAAADKPWKLAGRDNLKAGIIGLDTSHVLAFTKMLNAEDKEAPFTGIRVVAAYPKGSPDIESSTSRVPMYTRTVKEQGVEIVDSIEALLPKVDVIFLETNDGRPHLEQVLPVLKAGIPVFVDKPVAGSLADAIAIYKAAEHYDVPVFSSSSLRYSGGAQEVLAGKIGKVKEATAYSPCSLEPTHPDLFWYGIHGVELLFTVMGPEVESVRRVESNRKRDVVEGKWSDGREGVFEGYRIGKKGYGGTAIGENGTAELGPYKGYQPLLEDILRFFRTGEPSVTPKETLAIYAFMEAADESKRQGGVAVSISSVMKLAEKEADAKLEELLED
ncbi:Gfo/Idh/MocA family oxidoreductase [Thalassoroseus pseudoceratinae]|uniref:Gfo/Idh/MocA family oxidoreductase n=1 Tax=Thalassoroseus pseudoceratinae TaxID=2713176 RepID=UPI00142261E1|nr:Gfo/Idh/MocA family oxidoreductase [Thalassoroseus pseudoceratinae]